MAAVARAVVQLKEYVAQSALGEGRRGKMVSKKRWIGRWISAASTGRLYSWTLWRECELPVFPMIYIFCLSSFIGALRQQEVRSFLSSIAIYSLSRKKESPKTPEVIKWCRCASDTMLRQCFIIIPLLSLGMTSSRAENTSDCSIWPLDVVCVQILLAE